MFENLSLFVMAKKRMDWVAQRQEVLAKNVANADTPKYQSQDVKPLDFKETLQQTQQVSAAVTNPMHISTQPIVSDGQFDVVKVKKPYESAPDGNGVVLEEQMMKMNEAKGAYELAANLFQKNVKLLRTALGRGGA